VVCGALPVEVADLLKTIADERQSPSYFMGRDFVFSLKNKGLFDYTGTKWRLADLDVALRGRHQRRNAALALSALEIAAGDFPVNERAVRDGLKTVRWPGRFEIVRSHPTVVLDGAHNGEGVRALVEELEDFREGRRVRLLFASMEDKDWGFMLETLSEVVDEIVLTRVHMERSADPDKLAAHLGEKVRSRAIEDARSALEHVLADADTDEIILVAGSLYLLGEIRPMLVTTEGPEVAQQR
jgi:dihydrofolate synthase / folylpolyglutamate synthase